MNRKTAIVAEGSYATMTAASCSPLSLVTISAPSGARRSAQVVTYVLGTFCYRCVRVAEAKRGAQEGERQNMLKAIYVMAIKGYGYKPEDKRSTAITDIVSDLLLQGLPVSDDTIRRYLKEAREHLSEWQE